MPRNPTVLTSLLLWNTSGLNCGKLRCPPAPTGLPSSAVYCCDEESDFQRFGEDPYVDVVSNQITFGLSLGSCDSNEDVDADWHIISDLLRGALDSLLRGFECWYSCSMKQRAGSGMTVWRGGIPLGGLILLVFEDGNAEDAYRSIARVLENTRPGWKPVYPHLGYVVARFGGWPVRLGLVLEWEWQRPDGTLAVSFPVLVGVGVGRPPRGIVGLLEHSLVTIGKISYSYGVAAGWGSGRYVMPEPLFSMKKRELEARFRPEEVGVLGGFKFDGILGRYSWCLENGLVLFPTAHHFSRFLARVVEEYARRVRMIVGRNPEGGRGLAYDSRTIERVILELENVVSELYRVYGPLYDNLKILEKNIYNWRYVRNTLGLEGAEWVEAVERRADIAMAEFEEAVERVDLSIRILQGYIQQLKELEDAAGRITQRYLNHLMTILAFAGVYSVVRPLVSLAAPGLGDLAASILTLGASLGSVGFLRWLEARERRLVYER